MILTSCPEHPSFFPTICPNHLFWSNASAKASEYFSVSKAPKSFASSPSKKQWFQNAENAPVFSLVVPICFEKKQCADSFWGEFPGVPFVWVAPNNDYIVVSCNTHQQRGPCVSGGQILKSHLVRLGHPARRHFLDSKKKPYPKMLAGQNPAKKKYTTIWVFSKKGYPPNHEFQ